MTSKAQRFPALPSKTYVDVEKSSVKNNVSASTDMWHAISVKYP